MWNLEQTERFVVWTRPIILGVVLIILLLLTLNLNPVRLSRDLGEAQTSSLQHTLR
jgi:hypothetical protein